MNTSGVQSLRAIILIIASIGLPALAILGKERIAQGVSFCKTTFCNTTFFNSRFASVQQTELQKSEFDAATDESPDLQDPRFNTTDFEASTEETKEVDMSEKSSPASSYDQSPPHSEEENIPRARLIGVVRQSEQNSQQAFSRHESGMNSNSNSHSHAHEPAHSFQSPSVQSVQLPADSVLRNVDATNVETGPIIQANIQRDHQHIEIVQPRVVSRTSELATPVLTSNSSFVQIEVQLKELGATYYRLESLEHTGQYRFQCRMALPYSNEHARHFEASSRDPIAAMSEVLRLVKRWKRQQSSSFQPPHVIAPH